MGRPLDSGLQAWMRRMGPARLASITSLLLEMSIADSPSAHAQQRFTGGEILVKFSRDVGKNEITAINAAHGAHIVESGDFTPDDTFFYSQWYLHNSGQFGGTPDADVDAVEDTVGRDEFFGYGRVNMHRALLEVPEPTQSLQLAAGVALLALLATARRATTFVG